MAKWSESRKWGTQEQEEGLLGPGLGSRSQAIFSKELAFLDPLPCISRCLDA